MEIELGFTEMNCMECGEVIYRGRHLADADQVALGTAHDVACGRPHL
ncbi:hypothetical protein [Rhodococcus sp. 14-2470-1a]|nr:hypothetical protein [Rhodococcus sp. 14-2470-1a]